MGYIFVQCRPYQPIDPFKMTSMLLLSANSTVQCLSVSKLRLIGGVQCGLFFGNLFDIEVKKRHRYSTKENCDWNSFIKA